MNTEELKKRLSEIKEEFDQAESMRRNYIKTITDIEVKMSQLQGGYAEIERQLKALEPTTGKVTPKADEN